METSTSMPIGYRFRPTDEELVSHYLNHKLLGNDAIVNNVIADVDFLGSAPWDLPALSKVKSDDKEWFFFTCLDPMKSTKSKTRFNRKTNIKPETETKTKTKDGYWKITGKDREIKTKGTNIVIGIKKTLVFYGNQHEKTNWVMHEYHSFPDNKLELAVFDFSLDVLLPIILTIESY
ncbi:putative transcription factor NAM family [Medicago truncatula]|uniref:Putative transcription factor NAM family n=1 Tax=Medicago truncatula TaxID=3880 RepID=A0A396GDW9_MEDTR|nr:putative transcription factor NAM family [Medicago truncatula]